MSAPKYSKWQREHGTLGASFPESSIDIEATDLQNVAMAIHCLARAVQDLGFGQGGKSGPGALEGHTMMLRDTIMPMLADALRDGLKDIADAVQDAGGK